MQGKKGCLDGWMDACMHAAIAHVMASVYTHRSVIDPKIRGMHRRSNYQHRAFTHLCAGSPLRTSKAQRERASRI